MFFKRFLTFAMESLISIALIGASIYAVFWMYGNRQAQDSVERVKTAPTVEVVPVQKHEGGINFHVDGEVTPFRSLGVVPETPGRIIYKSENFRTGRSVTEGELLLKLDPIDYELEIEQLTESAHQAQVGIEENKIRKGNTEKSLTLAHEQLAIRKGEIARYESSTLPGAYSKTEIDSVRLSLLNTQNSVLQLENELSLLDSQTENLASVLRRTQSGLSLARLNLTRTEIKAPIAGVILNDSVEVNSYVQKGMSVAEILDTTKLEIQCSLQMKQIKWIWNGAVAVPSDNSVAVGRQGGYVFAPTPVTIIYELDGEKWSWQGKLQTLDGGGVNAMTRMVRCRVTVENPWEVQPVNSASCSDRYAAPPTLLAGMYVTIIIHTTPDATFYSIPPNALLPGNRIWTATGGILKRYQLKIANATTNGILFQEEPTGPRPGDLVIVSPLPAPVAGEEVTIAP